MRSASWKWGALSYTLDFPWGLELWGFMIITRA